MATAVQQMPSPPTFKQKRSSSRIPSARRRKSPQPPRPVEDVDRLPTQEELDRCAEIPILNKDGVATPFKSLYDQKQRHLVIFVRHFFCGMCQDYLRVLHSAISPSDLSSLSQPTDLTIIGCGSSDLIQDYTSYTQNCPFTIYADPSRQLHEQFDMISTLDQGTTKPAYQTSNFIAMVGRNMWQGITSGSGALKGGNFSQLGGEMLFENGKVVWCHRMRNTRDHTEVDVLKKILGL